MSQGLKTVIKTITTTLVIVAMLFAFTISGIRLLGFDIYGVLSGSMEPTYPTGSLIYVREVDPQTLRVNDVITYSMSGGTIVTHRIVEIVPNENNPSVYSYRTKGDANRDVDSALVSSYNIIGKVVFHLPGMGYVAQYIQSPPGMYIAIAACVAMIVFVFVTDEMMKDKPGAKKKGKKKGGKNQPMNVGAVKSMIPGKKQSASAARMQAKRQKAEPQEEYDEDEAQYARPQRSARQAQQPQQYAGQQQYARPQQPAQQQYARPQQPQQYARPQQGAPRITYEMLSPAQKDWYQEMIRRGYSHEQIMAHVQKQYDQQYAARQDSRRGQS